jgi:hypothetical protein
MLRALIFVVLMLVALALLQSAGAQPIEHLQHAVNWTQHQLQRAGAT